jgi:hypothetical protein
VAERTFQIFLPGEFEDGSGLRRLRASSVEAVTLPDGVVGEAGPMLFARTPVPAFSDHFHPYLTLDEIAKYIEQPVPLELPDSERVIEIVKSLPFEAAMRWTALIQRLLAEGHVEPAFQEAVAREVYPGRIGEFFVRALREFNGRAVAISEPQLFALQRLLVIHAREDAAGDLTPAEHAAVRTALAAIPGTILNAADEDMRIEERDAADITTEDWLRFFIGSGGLTRNVAFDHALARAHRIYGVIANSPAARRHPRYCPFDDWLREEYDGLGFVDLQAAGFAVLAGSRMYGGLGEPPVLIEGSYLDPTRLGGKMDTIFRALSADRATLRAAFTRSPQSPRRQAREILPFLQYPVLCQADGRGMVIAPRAIESWLSPAGTYWRLFHIAKAKSAAWKDRFFHFHGFLHERYVLHLAYTAHPGQMSRRRVGAAGVIHSETLYAQNGTSLTSDVIIDNGTDVVLIEATAKRLTIPSTLDAEKEKIEDDLNAMIVEKVEQLGRVMRDIGRGVAKLDGVDPRQISSFWPVLVTPENALQTPALWAYIDRECAGFFDLPRPECPQTVQPLVLLELEEYERLMGLVQEGASLIAILRRKTEPLWLDRDLKAMLNDDISKFGSGESRFIQQERWRAFHVVKRALQIHSTTRRSQRDIGTKRLMRARSAGR